MGMHGTVSQITSDGGGTEAFMNLRYGYGFVESFSNCFRSPTYIWIRGNTWGMKIFEDEIYAKEWLESRDFLESEVEKLFKIEENEINELHIK
jgi:hypothetical protein